MFFSSLGSTARDFHKVIRLTDLTIRICVILLLLQSSLLSAQHGSKVNPLPQKSKDCTPAEEKWWNDIRDKAFAISQLGEKFNEAYISYRNNGGEKNFNKLKALAGQMKQGRDELLTLIKVSQDNNYQAPVADQKLILLNSPLPDYTEEARRNREIGVVVMEGKFQADGRISNARIIRGLPYGLNEQALNAVYRIIFIPAIKDGHFEAFNQKVSVSFTLT